MMKEWWPKMIWFGADPGGADNFGVAVLREDGTYVTKCVCLPYGCGSAIKGVLITEAHPKALLRFLGLSSNLNKWGEIQECFKLKCSAPLSEHERDAVLAAVAAREGMTGVWSRDLSVNRWESELDPKRMWFGEVSYFWPNKPA